MYVELKNINKTYGDYKASDNVSFGIEREADRSSGAQRKRKNYDSPYDRRSGAAGQR